MLNAEFRALSTPWLDRYDIDTIALVSRAVEILAREAS